MSDYINYLSHKDVGRVVSEAREQIDDLSSEGEYRVYNCINENYLLVVPEVILDSKKATIEYFNGLEIPIERMDTIHLNNCNAFLVDRKQLEAVLILEDVE